MLILGIVAITLIVIICVAAIVHFRGKYKKAVAAGKEAEEKLRAAARAATGQRPVPGSGVDSAELAARRRAANRPEPPPNRTETGRALTQPRPRPRPRQSAEVSFDNL